MSKAAEKRRRLARMGLLVRRERAKEVRRQEREVAEAARRELARQELREAVLWEMSGPPDVEPPPPTLAESLLVSPLLAIASPPSRPPTFARRRFASPLLAVAAIAMACGMGPPFAERDER